MERLAVADRQAEMSIALAERWENYTPISVDERVEVWESWLAHDPTDTKEAREQRRIDELMRGA